MHMWANAQYAAGISRCQCVAAAAERSCGLATKCKYRPASAAASPTHAGLALLVTVRRCRPARVSRETSVRSHLQNPQQVVTETPHLKNTHNRRCATRGGLASHLPQKINQESKSKCS
eukprot:EC790533.1.p1 GENE.EC790533.1~~EC790533.1.p1  ORF type:complete len:118 (-),score=4.67 EC790533.1:70-423(-)